MDVGVPIRIIVTIPGVDIIGTGTCLGTGDGGIRLIGPVIGAVLGIILQYMSVVAWHLQF